MAGAGQLDLHDGALVAVLVGVAQLARAGHVGRKTAAGNGRARGDGELVHQRIGGGEALHRVDMRIGHPQQLRAGQGRRVVLDGDAGGLTRRACDEQRSGEETHDGGDLGACAEPTGYPVHMSWEDSSLLIAALVGLHGLLLAVTLWSLRSTLRRAAPFYTAILAVVAGTLSGVLVERLAPVRWFSVVREGFTIDHLRFAAGLGTHRGPLLRAFWGRWFFHDDLGFREIVALNSGLGVAAMVLLAGLAWERTRSLLPVVVVPAVLLLHPMGHTALLSETEAPLCSIYLVISAWLAAEGASTSLVLLGQACIAALLATCRPELAVFPVGALIGQASGAWGLRLEGWWTARFDALAAAIAAWPMRAVAAVALWVWLAECVIESPISALKQLGSFAWPIVAMDPLNDRLLTLLPVLLTLLPVGYVALVIAGGLTGLRHPVRSGFVVPGVLLLYGSWYLAAHGVAHGHNRVDVASWEMYRYMELAMPVLGLLAIEGFARLARRDAWIAAALCLVPPTTWAIRWLPPAFPALMAAEPANFEAQRPTAMTEQRLVLQQVEGTGCGVLTQGFPWSGERGAGTLQWAMLWRGERSWRVKTRAVQPGDTLAAVAGELGEASCVVAYRSLDCDADRADGCPWADGLMPITEFAQPFFPYVHPEHGIVWSKPTVKLGFYQIPGLPFQR